MNAITQLSPNRLSGPVEPGVQKVLQPFGDTGLVYKVQVCRDHVCTNHLPRMMRCWGAHGYFPHRKEGSYPDKEADMTREEAEALLKRYVKNERMLDHCYASEAVLRALARRLGGDEEKWGLAGLLHDIDIEAVGGDMARHGCEAERILIEAGLDPEIVDAVKMHNEAVCGTPRQTQFQHALAAGETVTGLIMATALVYPDRKIASVKVKSVTKRMKEKAFAASVNRETIRECERIGLPLEEFVEISLEAMQGIGGRLGL